MAGGLNTYSYVYNNPTNWIDPYGLDAAIGTAPQTGISFSLPAWARNPAGFAAWAATFSSPVGTDSDIVPSRPYYNRPPGFWPGDTGAREWDRRNNTGRKGRDKFHEIKGRDKGPASGPKDNCSVNPDAGEILDGNNDNIGYLDE